MSVKLLTEVRHAAGLTGWPKAILLVLADVSNSGRRSWWSRARLAEMAGCSVRTVSRALAVLEEAGWITREARHRRDGGRTSSVVRIRPAAEVAIAARAQMSLRLFRSIPVPACPTPPRASVAQQEATTSESLKHKGAEPQLADTAPARAAVGSAGEGRAPSPRPSLRAPTRAEVDRILLRGVMHPRDPERSRPPGRHTEIQDPPLAQVVWAEGVADEAGQPPAASTALPVLPGRRTA